MFWAVIQKYSVFLWLEPTKIAQINPKKTPNHWFSMILAVFEIPFLEFDDFNPKKIKVPKVSRGFEKSYFLDVFYVRIVFLPQNKLLWFNFWSNIFHSRIIGKNVFYMWRCGWWTVSRVCCCPTIEGGGEGAEEGVSRDWGSEGTCVVILPCKTTRLFFFHSTLCNLYKCVLVVRPFFVYNLDRDNSIRTLGCDIIRYTWDATFQTEWNEYDMNMRAPPHKFCL